MSRDRDPDPAFLALVDAHEEMLLRAARLLTGDWDRAEELLRDTLAWTLTAWQSLGADDAAPLRVRQRLVTTYLETEPGPDPATEQSESDGADGDDGADDEQNGEGGEQVGYLNGSERPLRRPALVDSLAGLAAEDRAVVVSRYYLGLSAGEIGEILGLDAEEISAAAAHALTVLRWAR
jgi:DNA-directed RNA polymerase specialized sigma24 family protein